MPTRPLREGGLQGNRHTARGEEVLHHATVWGVHLPGQALDTPTYHPYNTAMQPGRLDYLKVKGVKPVKGGSPRVPPPGSV